MGWMVNATPWPIYPRKSAPKPIVDEAAWAQGWYRRGYRSENRLTHRSSNSGPSSLWRVTIQCALSRPISKKRAHLNIVVCAYLLNALPKLFQQFISLLLLQHKCKDFGSNHFWTNVNQKGPRVQRICINDDKFDLRISYTRIILRHFTFLPVKK
jgi:hypothetical protein